MAEITISRYSSLNFTHDWKLPFQMASSYVQKFLPDDNISIQYIVAIDELSSVSMELVNIDTGVSTFPEPLLLSSEDDVSTYMVEVSDLPLGNYTLKILSETLTIAWSSFRIVEDIEDSVLLTYTHRQDEFDTIFGEEEHRFCFRVEGVFLPSEFSFLAETSDFRDQRYSLTQLSAFPYEKQTLTIGGRFGVPNWVARKLNLILSLSNVIINGATYTRSDGSTAEITVLNQHYPRFNYKIELEQKDFYTDSFDSNAPQKTTA